MTGMRNHLLVHNIQNVQSVSQDEPPLKKHIAQSLITRFSKKQSLDEIIVRLAAEDRFTYLKIRQSKFIRSSLQGKRFRSY